MGVMTSSPLNAIKLLYLHPYKTTDNLHWVYAGEIDPALVLCSDEPWFHLSGWLILRITGTGLHKIPYLSSEYRLRNVGIRV